MVLTVGRAIIFQSTPPVWGATLTTCGFRETQNISIHAPRVGGDPGCMTASRAIFYFNPRPPCGGRPCRGISWAGTALYFNPRPPCGGRPSLVHQVDDAGSISIHAPRVGGDFTVKDDVSKLSKFQSTPPVWGATEEWTSTSTPWSFQSTPPVWGATSAWTMGLPLRQNFNPRPPWGGRRLRPQACPCPTATISIHAPRVGGDDRGGHGRYAPVPFQSTPPVWGATLVFVITSDLCNISIHAPRVGGDCVQSRQIRLRKRFQSTPPVWGATPA